MDAEGSELIIEEIHQGEFHVEEPAFLGMTMNRRHRVTIKGIAEGMPIYVLGYCVPSGNGLQFAKPPEKFGIKNPFIVSTKSEEGTLGAQRSTANGYTCAAVVFGMISLGILRTQVWPLLFP